MTPNPLAARVQADMNFFNGMRILESPHLEEDGEPYTLQRTWRERLFSRPWRPFVATRVIIPRVPYRGALQLDAATLMMHPQTLRQLRLELEKRR